MLFIRRKLLATLAALAAIAASGLGLTGCQSLGRCDRCSSQASCAPCTYGGATTTCCQPTAYPAASSNAMVSLGTPVGQEPLQPVAQTGVSRPLWRVARRTSRNKTSMPIAPLIAPVMAQAPPCDQCAPARPQMAMMLRPVPIGAPLPEPSEWSPVQRVSAEASPGGGAQAVSFVPTTQPGTEPPLASGLPAAPQLVLMQPDKADKDDAKKDKSDKDKKELSMPRVSRPIQEVPAPIVTNPPHAPREFQKHALSAYIIEPPDVLQIDLAAGVGDETQPITGVNLVRPDGTIGFGTYGSVFVAGMTIDQAKMRIVETIFERQRFSTKFTPEKLKGQIWDSLKVDVAAFNSKVYYVVTDGGGYGEQVTRVPITGNETVLDAISQIQGLPAVASKQRIWVARATPHDHNHPMILPVDWDGIVRAGNSLTNYQIFPGDRVYVNSSKLIRLDSKLAKIISPIERLLGITLLGSTTVNSIQGNQGGIR